MASSRLPSLKPSVPMASVAVPGSCTAFDTANQTRSKTVVTGSEGYANVMRYQVSWTHTRALAIVREH